MSFLLPNIAYAADESLDQFISNVDKVIINPLIILIFALAVVYFLWGTFDFLSNADNEEKRTSGKMHMIYGIIGMTIMMGVFAIMNLILNTFNIDGVKVESNSVHLDDYDPPYP